MAERNVLIPNEDIRSLCKQRKIPMWMVADRFNISEQTFYRRLRHTLDESEHNQIIAVIDQIYIEMVSVG